MVSRNNGARSSHTARCRRIVRVVKIDVGAMQCDRRSENESARYLTGRKIIRNSRMWDDVHHIKIAVKSWGTRTVNNPGIVPV